MKRYNFNQIGGMPLTQDRLNWMQDAYLGGINALASIARPVQPVVVAGMDLITDISTDDTVTDGWILHPELGLLAFVGGKHVGKTVVFVQESNPLQYANGTQYNVEINVHAKLGLGGISLTGLLKKRFMPAVGAANRTEWQAITGNFGALQYRIDHFANRVDVTGNVTMPAGTTIVPYEVAFSNLPFPDPHSDHESFNCLIHSQGNEFYTTSNNQKIHSRVGKMKRSQVAPGVYDPAGLRLLVPLLEQTIVSSYTCLFSFSYYF